MTIEIKLPDDDHLPSETIGLSQVDSLRQRSAKANTAELRQRAETTLREKTANTPEQHDTLSQQEPQRMLHELRVHQIELEMQNEELRRAQQELEDSQSRYFDLYDLAPVGYCTVSKFGLILEANLTFATMLDEARGALVTNRFSRFILTGDQHNFYLLRKKLIETNEPQSCELRLLKSDETQFWVNLTANVVTEEAGDPVFRIVISDNTQRKLAEEKLRVSDLALKAVSQGVIITGADQIIISVNDAFKSITGYSEEEILGRNCNFLHGAVSDPRTVKAIHLALNSVTEFFGEILNYRKNGTLFWNDLAISPICDDNGQLTHFISVIRDISERKRADDQLRTLSRAVEYSPTAIVITDISGKIEYASRQLPRFGQGRVLGQNRPEAVILAVLRARCRRGTQGLPDHQRDDRWGHDHVSVAGEYLDRGRYRAGAIDAGNSQCRFAQPCRARSADRRPGYAHS